MRKSLAPSCQSAKRLKFMSPIIQSDFHLDPEIDVCSSIQIPKPSSVISIKKTETETIPTSGKSDECLRSTDDVLKLLSETSPIISDNHYIKKKVNANENIEPRQVPEESKRNYHDESYKSVTNISSFKNADSVFYSVLWCKRSAKKHKIWEGDGTLIVTNRSAVLKNSEGKVIDRGIGYKLKDIESLEEGSKFNIGGKECEIQSVISSDETLIDEKEESLSAPTLFNKKNSPSALRTVFKNPLKIFENLPASEPVENDEFCFPTPTVEHQELYNKKNLPLTPVKLESFIEKQLRTHQKEGIIFMYKCILGFQHQYGQGVILADEMGLGKTLQCIALIWTLYKQGPYGGKPVLKRIIILTPSSLVTNWKKEFHKWLGESRMSIFCIDKKNSIKDYLKFPKEVLILSYEMFLRSSESLSTISFDLVICDEGHRIKNLNIKISNVVNCLSTTARILLTGTPVQNDLAEFFSIVDFVNPGSLGSIQSFRRRFEKPILQSRNQDCTAEEKELGEDQSEELGQITASFLLRRTQEVINRYLPPKCEMVVFCKPTDIQKTMYNSIINSGSASQVVSSFDSSLYLIFISVLRKLCNHPSLLFSDVNSENNYVMSSLQSVFPTSYKPSLYDSGKMRVLEKILSSLFSSEKEKIVIVSAFTQTLNLIEDLCTSKNYQYLRLDGSTATSNRQELVDVFNKSYTKYSVFLLSSKAGGVGFNLIGASRIVLYDIDWNPANDLQAMARIWRDGQKRRVFVYRLLTTGTIEEKMFQRQISKQGLSGRVMNPGVKEKLKFSQNELKDLFTFHDDTKSLTHDSINCGCLHFEKQNAAMKEDCEPTKQSHVSANKNIGMEELMSWRHIKGPIKTDNCVDFTLENGRDDISFLFVNEMNSCPNRLLSISV